MLTFFRRFGVNSLKMARKYPKLSFLTGVVAITSFSVGFEKYKSAKLPAVLVPGFKKQTNPIIRAENLYHAIENLPIETFKTKTPLYPEDKIYEGYDLLRILKAMDIEPKKDDLVIFQAKDGFKSHIPFKRILHYKPKLAVRQKSAPQGQDWELVAHPLNGKTGGGPFYLMFPGTSYQEVGENDWAFGVVKITLGSFQKIFGALAPDGADDPAIKDGFKLFAQNCACCHMFFKQGTANVGTPVEKMPAKYPEYGHIADYAEDPQGVSKHSIMPPQKELSRKELDAIEKYIRFKTQEGIVEEKEGPRSR